MKVDEKAKAFRSLHERDGAFVIPNPWDIGSASMLAGLGFEALATTSSGHAYSMGCDDGELTMAQKLAHCRALCASTDLPVSADLEKCFADDPDTAAKNLRAFAESGIVGASIEDYSGDANKPIYDFELAVERVHAAVEVTQTLDFDFILTARAENLLHGHNDVDDTIKRLQAFEAAGAQVLYAPGLKTLDQVRLVTGALQRPVNVLAPMMKGVTVTELAQAGAKRISVGGALARAAFAALISAGEEMRDLGTFAWTRSMASGEKIEKLLSRDAST